MDDAESVTATFTLIPSGSHTLTVLKAGDGSGTVSSTPAGIDCGSDCTEDFTAGTVVTLTANVDAASTFSGWSGACSGTGDCVVTMDGAKSVTATFDTYTICLPFVARNATLPQALLADDTYVGYLSHPPGFGG
jgi:hypothetical protein